MASIHRPAEVVPNPDPSAITTAHIDKEVANLEKRMGARLDGMEKAVEVFHADLTRVPTLLDRSIVGLRELLEANISKLEAVMLEKFTGIRTQIVERDVQTEKASKDVKSAVDAAFAAAKEAVGEQNKSNALSITKSENATTKQIDGILELLRTSAKATDDKINDIKERITTIESVKKGANDNTAMFIAIGAVAIAAVALFVRLGGAN